MRADLPRILGRPAVSIALALHILTSFWVYFDARRIGVRKGQVSGIANMPPSSWLLGSLLLSIVTIPLYLSKRHEFARINDKKAGSNMLGWVAYSALLIFALLPYTGLLRMSTPELEIAVQKSITETFAANANLAAVVPKAVNLNPSEGDRYLGTVTVESEGISQTIPLEVNYDGRELRWETKAQPAP